MIHEKRLCADMLETSYKDRGVLVELHRTGGKHYITVSNARNNAFEVSQGYLSFEQVHAAYARILARLAAGYDYAALVDLLNS